MLAKYEDRPFHMYEENNKYRDDDLDSQTGWKDETPCDVLKSFIDWNMEAMILQGFKNVRPKIETWQFEEMRKRAGYTQEQINEDVVKIYPKEFANEYLNKTEAYYKRVEIQKSILNLDN